MRRQGRLRRRQPTRRWLASLALAAGAACGTEPGGPPVELTVPHGAGFDQVLDSLEERGVVGGRTVFGLYARMRGADRRVHAGRYAFVPGASWGSILDDLTSGRVLTESVTIPEGVTLSRIAERVATVSRVPADSVLGLLTGDSAHVEHRVPGPGLEGYLLPETYRFAPGTPPVRIIATMADAYREFWTEERLARLDSLRMTQGEVTTLASIVQAEARFEDEMPVIAAVYHNRLEGGWPLQADPTVLYALGGTRERLLFAAIDSVADHPYNTYRRAGLPPGPIGAPGRAALEATLSPADVPYMYFVASPDGRHLFSRTLAEHNRAVAQARRARDSAGAPDGR